ncbi:DUF1311 domain-containing protein [Ferrimonas sediminicola]|uniref:DUF1311 domain-containing protein n=1 Tax=Ferrimonas sediminicola TaxID=2569538 RepID=A0A4V5NVB9_9GAMM|nr:MliC family protein [Ferrimonas sediminicola]TKB49809.1 DUF1311 domain-containing protein [Ferrimonas sediminicola]
MRILLLSAVCLALCACSVVSPSLPSFPCDAAGPSSIETLICQTPELAELDKELDRVYAAAASGAEQADLLSAYQRGWVKGRNECWKSADPQGCTRESYRTRISELKAQYRLIPASARVDCLCGGAQETLSVSFFPSLIPTAVAHFRGQSSLMFQQPAASGSRYQGRNESLWEHQGEARLVWGYGAEPLNCVKVRR